MVTKGLQGQKPRGPAPTLIIQQPSPQAQSRQAPRGSAGRPGSHSGRQPRQDLQPGRPGF